MNDDHDTRPKLKRVAEPVQVYLERPDRMRLDRLVTDLGATKSDVLRRALKALEQQLTDPASHPALALIAIADRYPRPSPGKATNAADHDAAIAEDEIASWAGKGASRRGR